jgi:hypothetical protein
MELVLGGIARCEALLEKRHVWLLLAFEILGQFDHEVT